MFGQLPGFRSIDDALTWMLLFFITAKIVSTAALVYLGNYRDVSSGFRRLLYLTGKVTPFFLSLTAAALYWRQGDHGTAWTFIGLSVYSVALATVSVGLRKSGKFFGLGDVMQRYLTPKQVKALLLLVLGFILMTALHSVTKGHH